MLLTCTRDSGRLIFRATSSRMNISGYRVFWKRDSITSNWALVKVVRSRLCFLGLLDAYGDTGKENETITICTNLPSNSIEKRDKNRVLLNYCCIFYSGKAHIGHTYVMGKKQHHHDHHQNTIIIIIIITTWVILLFEMMIGS